MTAVRQTTLDDLRWYLEDMASIPSERARRIPVFFIERVGAIPVPVHYVELAQIREHRDLCVSLATDAVPPGPDGELPPGEREFEALVISRRAVK